MVTNNALPLRVAIVGSGLTGLIIAQGLRKNGIQAILYEREPCLDHRARDWTLMIHWGLEALHTLVPDDIVELLPQAYCDPFLPYGKLSEGMPCFAGSTGEVLYTIPVAGIRRVSRQRCRQVLSRGLDIRFNKALANIIETTDDHVDLCFENGSREQADIVIGADGTASKTREVLLGEEVATPKRAPWVIATTTFTYNDAFKARFARSTHPLWAMAYDPTGICALAVQHVKDPEEPGGWEFTLLRFWEGDTSGTSGPAALNEVKQRTKHFCEPFSSAIEWIPGDSSCNVDQLRYWVTVPWDNRNGRVTLAGDAAHATLPFRGQGFNVTLNDAKQLVDCLVQINDGASREHLIREYDLEIFKRGKDVVLNALEEGKKAMNFQWADTKAAKHGVAKTVAQEIGAVANV